MQDMKINDTNARKFIKQLKDECKGYRNFYIKLNGKEPSKQDVQTLTNYVNRSNYDMVFILKVLNTFDLHHATFEQFFNGEVPPRPKKKAKKADDEASSA